MPFVHRGLPCLRFLAIKRELFQERTNDSIVNSKGKEQIEEKGEPSLVCPQCGSLMIKRRAAKGSNAGNEFWGCSGFPKCRGIVNIK